MVMAPASSDGLCWGNQDLPLVCAQLEGEEQPDHQCLEFGSVEEELQEQEFLDRCFQEMLEEEDQDWFIPSRDLPQGMGQLQQQLNGLSVCDGHSSEDILSKSNLNPDAKEFVPGVKY
ncbi:polyadenylate-binding protein-interacting protein 2B isoform X2 [Strigops habroptila]|uniref:polyadenylate-binding protein-interacting protein 2B isoform X2 n=1 Tax=Strigops habroptila TaxID=2489341 RepID=UPI0011CFF434|nr:polyadenylate-binding protein-interacting protein 2B isoform X2 [Strigops habroptila]